MTQALTTREIAERLHDAPPDATVKVLVDGEPVRVVTKVTTISGAPDAIIETSPEDGDGTPMTVKVFLQEIGEFGPLTRAQLFFSYSDGDHFNYDEIADAGTSYWQGAGHGTGRQVTINDPYLQAGDFLSGG